jgi:hypothetical protein
MRNLHRYVAVMSPTVFGILLAIKNKRALLICGVANAMFMVGGLYKPKAGGPIAWNRPVSQPLNISSDIPGFEVCFFKFFNLYRYIKAIAAYLAPNAFAYSVGLYKILSSVEDP